MERLTERTADGILVKENYEKETLKTLYSCYDEKPNLHYSNCEEGYCAMEKLADYEDAEEQGRLFKLPCMDKFLESVSNQDFDRRISEVVEMLEEKQLYGTISLIKDLKYYLDLAIEEKNKAIDNFQNELKNHYTEYNIDSVLEDTEFYSYTTACDYLEDYIDEIAEKLKKGGENESSN
nr:MAG TPA: hypothetical protein [Caudoviricetes sp.]